MMDNKEDTSSVEQRRADIESHFLAQGIINENAVLIECVLQEKGKGVAPLGIRDMSFIASSCTMIDMVARISNIADWRNCRGKTLMHYAYQGTGEEIDKLISYGCDLNAQDDEGNTPLHDFVSISDNNRHLAHRMLLKRGASLNIKNNKGETPIDVAAFADFSHTYVDLSRARNHGTFISGAKLMQACCDNDATFMADYFLEPNERKEFGHKDDLIGRRVKYDYDEDWKPEECGDVLLKSAVLHNANDVIKILLNKINPCIVDEEAHPLFLYAVIQGKADTVQVFLDDERTDINFAGDASFSPLEYAIYSGKTDIVKLLLNDERIQIVNKTYLLKLSESYPEITALLEKVEETPKVLFKSHSRICKRNRNTIDNTFEKMERALADELSDKLDAEEQSRVRISHQNGAYDQYDNSRGR